MKRYSIPVIVQNNANELLLMSLSKQSDRNTPIERIYFYFVQHRSSTQLFSKLLFTLIHRLSPRVTSILNSLRKYHYFV